MVQVIGVTVDVTDCGFNSTRGNVIFNISISSSRLNAALRIRRKMENRVSRH